MNALYRKSFQVTCDWIYYVYDTRSLRFSTSNHASSVSTRAAARATPVTAPVLAFPKAARLYVQWEKNILPLNRV